MIRSDFSRLLSASKILAANGDTSGALALIDAAAALVPGSEAGLCGKSSNDAKRPLRHFVNLKHYSGAGLLARLSSRSS